MFPRGPPRTRTSSSWYADPVFSPCYLKRHSIGGKPMWWRIVSNITLRWKPVETMVAQWKYQRNSAQIILSNPCCNLKDQVAHHDFIVILCSREGFFQKYTIDDSNQSIAHGDLRAAIEGIKAGSFDKYVYMQDICVICVCIKKYIHIYRSYTGVSIYSLVYWFIVSLIHSLLGRRLLGKMRKYLFRRINMTEKRKYKKCMVMDVLMLKETKCTNHWRKPTKICKCVRNQDPCVCVCVCVDNSI